MIDYKQIPEVAEIIERLDSKDMKEEDGLRFDTGKKLTLDVEVTDPNLFHIVMGSMFRETLPLTIPGAKLEAVHVQSPTRMLAEEQINWLEVAAENYKNKAEELRKRFELEEIDG